jgi:hypothetical protein
MEYSLIKRHPTPYNKPSIGMIQSKVTGIFPNKNSPINGERKNKPTMAITRDLKCDR